MDEFCAFLTADDHADQTLLRNHHQLLNRTYVSARETLSLDASECRLVQSLRKVQQAKTSQTTVSLFVYTPWMVYSSFMEWGNIFIWNTAWNLVVLAVSNNSRWGPVRIRTGFKLDQRKGSVRCKQEEMTSTPVKKTTTIKADEKKKRTVFKQLLDSPFNLTWHLAFKR